MMTVLRVNGEVKLIDYFAATSKMRDEQKALGQDTEIHNAVPCGACGAYYADDRDAMCCPCHDL